VETIGTGDHSGRITPADFDLTVVGGGPAGTCAAITAARAGSQVLLLERGRLPRQRVCGEFVSAESLALLTGLLEHTAADLVHKALHIPEARLFFDGRVVTTPVEPCAASIARLDLDFALWRAAEHAAVDAKMQTTVQTITGSGPFVLTTSAGTFQSRAVINASGRWSNLGGQSALVDPDASSKNQDAKWLGVKAHFSEPNPYPSVDLYFFDGGYCGVQPVDIAGASNGAGGRVNACAMVRSDVARTLPEIFQLHPELRERSHAWKPLAEPVSTSPLIFREPTPIDNGIFMAGDAAGFVDPFVGDGISLALRSGTLAAECLAPFFARMCSLVEAESRYARSYREQLLPVFRNSSKVRRLLSLPRPIRRSVGRVLETPALSRLLVRLTR